MKPANHGRRHYTACSSQGVDLAKFGPAFLTPAWQPTTRVCPHLAFQLPHNLILRQSGNSSCFSPLRLAVPFPPLQICASLHITPQIFSGVRGFEYHTSS